MVVTERKTWIKPLTLVVLLVYWLALVISTHLPHPPSVIFAFHWTDKLLHWTAYAGLAFVFALYCAVRRPTTARALLVMFALLAGFGILDELTQIPVGRTCDPYDWLCDTIGIACGLLAFALVETWWRGRAARRAPV